MVRRASTLVLAPFALSLPCFAQWAEADSVSMLELAGTQVSDTFGWAARSLGDVDGDGTPDIVTSAPLNTSGASAGGQVVCHSGATGAALWTRNGMTPSGILGYALEVHDQNGDGILDVFASAPFASGGEVFVFDGTSGATLATFDTGHVAGDGFGASIDLGDVDGDGDVDLIVGSIGYDPAGLNNAGRVTVHDLASGALITSFDGPAPVGLDAEFGVGLAFLGDVSTPPDGRGEIAVGQRETSFFEGRATVLSFDGSALSSLYSVDGVGMGYNLFSDRMDGGLDVDGDGLGDFLVGDLPSDETKVFSGADGTLLHTLTGLGQGGSFGAGHFVPDLNGDGAAELILGARRNSAGANEGGRVFLYSGATGTVMRVWTRTTDLERIGVFCHDAGDFDGDGIVDFLFGGTGGGTSGPPVGHVVLVRGTSGHSTYCAPGTSTVGCAAVLEARGQASRSQNAGFSIEGSAFEGGRMGVLFFGHASTEQPWGSSNSVRCVRFPLVRAVLLQTGGTPGGCDGAFNLDFNAWMAAHPGRAPQPGGVAYLQTWVQDPGSPTGSTLSSALAVTVAP